MAFIDNTIEVAADVHEVYEAWMAFERYPAFMETIERVALARDDRLHWIATVDDRTYEWNVELVEPVVDEKIWWRAIDGREAGEVRFEKLAADRTRVTYQLEYDPLAWEGDADDVRLWMTRRVNKDLGFFKTMVEDLAGGKSQAAATKNQASGAPSAAPVPAKASDQPVPAKASDQPVPAGPPDTFHMVVAYLIVLAGMLAGWVLWKGVKPQDFVPAPGVSIFAAIYIFAQCIERITEPVSSISALGINTAMVDGTNPVSRAPAAIAGATKVPTTRIGKAEALQNLAADPTPAHQAVVEQVKRNRAVLLWGFSSLLAMLASGGLGLFLLRSVGLKGAPTWLDILVTGLAIGSGTKPLHDLISNLQQSSSQKEKSATTSTQ